MNGDTAALRRLLDYVNQAVAEQDPHVADQLNAALRDGRTALGFRERGGAVWAVVTIDGAEVAEVDLRNLVPLDDL